MEKIMTNVRILRGFSLSVALLCFSSIGIPQPAANDSLQDEVRPVFVRFVAAQNAHDADTVRSMIWDSPDFLWVSRGTQVRGSQQAIDVLRSYYKVTWHIEPDMTRFKARKEER
jgi:hypothetical protein